MREIKFRAWNKFYNKMYKDLLIADKCIVQRYVDMNGQICFRTLETYYDARMDFVPLQYTGLKDKNGKEIYEGDIVKIEKCFTNGFELSDHVGEIKYTNCTFKAIDEYLNSLCPYEYKNSIEVIGNIYENKDLLCE